MRYRISNILNKLLKVMQNILSNFEITMIPKMSIPKYENLNPRENLSLQFDGFVLLIAGT